ncbi:MAG: CZB domain-containing protein, partial [Candidatus Aquicultor sp.]
MKTLSIKSKLYLAFGAIIVILLIASIGINKTNGYLLAAQGTVIRSSEFESQAKTFQKQHADWLNALANHVFVGTKFDKHLDPHECAFGKWYYGYINSEEFKQQTPEIQQALRSLEEPHNRLHVEGALVIDEINKGHRANAAKLYKQNTLPTISALDTIYNNLVNASAAVKNENTKAAESAQRTQSILIVLITILGALVGIAVAYLLANNINKMIGEVLEVSESVANATDQISAGNQELAQRTQEQASAVEETAATIDQMAATIKQTAEGSVRADQMARDAANLAQNGGHV